MSEEKIKELARESMLETLKTNLDSAMIFTYVKSLEDRIDKAIQYIKENEFYYDYKTGACVKGVIPLLNILRGENNGKED